MQIFVNGESVEVDGSRSYISYEDLCELAEINADSNPSVIFTTKANKGIINKGFYGPLTERAIYNVCCTGNA